MSATRINALLHVTARVSVPAGRHADSANAAMHKGEGEYASAKILRLCRVVRKASFVHASCIP
ncbi:hypothetical protein [Dyella sp. 20L07]|uniref:hypothetical protein n=1 Tax=Dyella sp. 20L07 TaxID=3384240 RepID=UPI003D284C92